MVRLLRSGQTGAKVYGNLKRKVCTEFADYISTKKTLSVKRWICGEDSAGIRNVCNHFCNNQDMHVMLLLKKAT